MSRLMFFCLLASACGKNYCKLSTDHTMCRFGEDPGHACGSNSVGGVSEPETKEIVKAHNELRRRLAKGQEKLGPQPPAANMRAILWDSELARVAQRWADQCSFRHDKCRDDLRFSVGQNIYWSLGIASVDWSRAVQTWYNEVSNFNASGISSFSFDHNTAHYSQLAWADTWRVGCGRRSYGQSYRPKGSRPLEFVLGSSDKKQTEEIGFFGGASFDLTGGRGAITRPKGKKKVDPVPLAVPSQQLQDKKLGEEQLEEESSSSEDSDEAIKEPSSRIQTGFITIATHREGIESDETYELSPEHLLVCNYGPSGNRHGEPLYEPGETCSRCPLDTYCRSGLCECSTAGC